MQMYKIVNLLSYGFLLPTLLVFSAEVSHIDVAKILAQKQKEHGDLIDNGGKLLDLYKDNLEKLSQCTGQGDSLLNQVFGNLQHVHEQFATALNEYQERHDGKYTAYEIMPLLESQAALIKEGLKSSKDNLLLQLQFKITADCLSRWMVREFHAFDLNWKVEPLMHAKNVEERKKDAEMIKSIKTGISKGRMVYKAFHGWMFSLFSPIAALGIFAAVKKPSIITGGLAAALTAWSGYNGYAYIHLKNLPAPSDDDAYKRWAINLKPQFPE